jgi:hypothetical protein
MKYAFTPMERERLDLIDVVATDDMKTSIRRFHEQFGGNERMPVKKVR